MLQLKCSHTNVLVKKTLNSCLNDGKAYVPPLYLVYIVLFSYAFESCFSP